MKIIISSFLILASTMVFLAKPGSKTDFAFDFYKYDQGYVFVALNRKTGQIYSMMDHGSDPGLWSSFGPPIRRSGGSDFVFQNYKYEQGYIFLVMDSSTGQIYSMMDHGSDQGQWIKFGGPISPNRKSKYDFRYYKYEQGYVFLAMDSKAGQIYSMMDHGADKGQWIKFGASIQ